MGRTGAGKSLHPLDYQHLLFGFAVKLTAGRNPQRQRVVLKDCKFKYLIINTLRFTISLVAYRVAQNDPAVPLRPKYQIALGVSSQAECGRRTDPSGRCLPSDQILSVIQRGRPCQD